MKTARKHKKKPEGMNFPNVDHLDLSIAIIDLKTKDSVTVQISDGHVGIIGRGAVLDWFCDQIQQFRTIFPDSLPYSRKIHETAPNTEGDKHPITTRPWRSQPASAGLRQGRN